MCVNKTRKLEMVVSAERDLVDSNTQQGLILTFSVLLEKLILLKTRVNW